MSRPAAKLAATAESQPSSSASPPLVGEQLGAYSLGEQTRFAVWTDAPACALVLYDGAGNERTRLPLEPQGQGVFSLTLSDAGHGTLYKFVVGDPSGEAALPDPYARFLPEGVHGPAMVYQSSYQFRHEPIARPLAEHVIYELHVGTFTPEGTYIAAIARLPELLRLGITTIELMPVAAFAGTRGWGYDGVAHFAPFAPYGTPDDLRRLVDEAHGLGLSVLLDVVYNHFGPAGNYLSAYNHAYFTREIPNPWGESPDYRQTPQRAYAIDNALYWLRDFRFDGLRLDAVHAIVDPSPKHVLRELVESVRQLSPPRLLIAEDDRNDPDVIQQLGFDAVWADDFHHQVRVTLTGERDGYYAGYEPGIEGIARVIERGWLYEGQKYPLSDAPRGKPFGDLRPENLVYCIQNHDQIGNRALGDRVSAAIGIDAYCAISTLLLFLPATPMLFMGQEWAASSPFLYFSDHEAELGEAVSRGRREEFKHFRAFSDPEVRSHIPDPQAVETFERSTLDWSERETGEHARVLELYSELLAMRKTDEVLMPNAVGKLSADVVSGLLRVTRFAEGQERVLLVNFGDQPVSVEALELPADLTVLFSSGAPFVDDLVPPRTAVILATLFLAASS
jgi:maltooligosyltrehalose trehalohydrolase